ncbi:hypothetical protein QBC45DRAFT_458852, partial [Copromyces sp. CBS 386.78]
SISGSSRSPTKSSSTRSPQKAWDRLEIFEGLARRNLSLLELDLPSPLVDLLEVVEPLTSGIGVISPSAKDAITSHPRPIISIGIDDSKYSARRDTYGPTPSTEHVLNILEAAANCEQNSHHESTWNTEVHQRVLETALRFRSSNQPKSNLFAQPVNFTACTTAGIGIGKPPLAPFQKIDFCLYIDPAKVGGPEGEDYIKTIDAVRKSIPDHYQSINHTDHFPPRRNPITVSIETKRSGDNWDEAGLRIAVWQAAQWNFLRWMAQGDTDGDSSSSSRAVGDMRHETRNDLGLEFLPGIVIMGHEWFLTATTNDGKSTTFWSRVQIGSTESALGVYKIICVVQYLAQWSRDVYWPWFRQTILKSNPTRTHPKTVRRPGDIHVHGHGIGSRSAAGFI